MLDPGQPYSQNNQYGHCPSDNGGAIYQAREERRRDGVGVEFWVRLRHPLTEQFYSAWAYKGSGWVSSCMNLLSC